MALGNPTETHPDNDPKNKHLGTVIVAILVDSQIVASETRDDAALPKGTFTDVTVSFRASSDSPLVGRPIKARVAHVSPGGGTTGFRVDFDNVRLATGAAPTPTPRPTPSPTPAEWKSRVISSFPDSPSFDFDSDAAAGPSHSSR